MERCRASRLRRGAVSRQSRKTVMIESGESLKTPIRPMRLGPKTGCGYAQRGQLQHFVKHGVPWNAMARVVSSTSPRLRREERGEGEEDRYSIGRPRGLGPRGKALSSAAISASLSFKFPAPALSAACSALDAFG